MSTFPGELHPDRSEPFDELAQDMDAWTAATGILAAAGGYRSSQAVLEADANRLCLDGVALDQIAAECLEVCAWMRATWPDGPHFMPIPKGILAHMDRVEEIIRSTGRTC